jgi:hypothetical protein
MSTWLSIRQDVINKYQQNPLRIENPAQQRHVGTWNDSPVSVDNVLRHKTV